MNPTTKKTLRVIALTLELVQDLVRDNRIRLLEERVNELEKKDRIRTARERITRQREELSLVVQNPFLPRHPAGGSGFTAKDL